MADEYLAPLYSALGKGAGCRPEPPPITGRYESTASEMEHLASLDDLLAFEREWWDLWEAIRSLPRFRVPRGSFPGFGISGAAE